MKSIKIILLFSIIVNCVKCQNSTDYNSQRFGFGSVDASANGSSTVSTNALEKDYSTGEETTTVDTSGGGLVISVDNVTVPNTYSTVSPRQVPYVPVTQSFQQQQQQQQQFFQNDATQSGKNGVSLILLILNNRVSRHIPSHNLS